MSDTPAVYAEVQARLRSIESQIEFESAQVAAREAEIEASNLKICDLRRLRYEWGLVRDNLTPSSQQVDEARQACARGTGTDDDKRLVRLYGAMRS